MCRHAASGGIHNKASRWSASEGKVYQLFCLMICM